MEYNNRLLLKGNEALVYGALLAGCDCFFGYPITPASEIAHSAAALFPKLNRVFIQAESEIAAINMVIGAVAEGRRAMTASSGLGISLKQEEVSYLAAYEMPAVIADITRGGPGLGNIGPEQADYFQLVKGGGHGSYKCLVFTPNSVQEMCDMAYESFRMAEKYRMPAVRLDDDARQLLLSYRWPGNIRELKNVTERISVIEEKREISADILRLYLPNVNVAKYPVLVKQENEQRSFNNEREILYQILFDMRKDVNDLKKLVHDIIGGTVPVSVDKNETYPSTIHPVTTIQPPVQEAETVEEESMSLEDVEKDMIRRALERHNGKRKNAAADLKISERTLYRKIKEYNLE